MNKKFFAKRKGAASVSVAIAVLSLAIIFSQTSSAQLTFQGRTCNGNSICDVIRNCDANGCTSSFENCQSCGTTSKVCANGVATAPNTCVDSGTPQCKQGTPVCSNTSGQGSSDPHVILTFTVFTKKNLAMNVTPDTQTGLAGKTLNYRIGVENKNPKQLSFQITYQIPQGWQINIPQSVSIAANGKTEIPFRVTSNETASDASYPVTVGMFNSELNLFGTTTATYVVASRGAPTIAASPRSQPGYPGQQLFYNISVTNNDPADFDATSIALRAHAPDGFNAVFTPNSISLQPQATGYVRLDVTSPGNATEATYGLTINATANKLTAVEFIEYKIDFCGNGVCDIGEENSCVKDCPSDANFQCSGRCEREVDDGLVFSASVNIPYNKFIVCSRNASLSACVQSAGKMQTSDFPGINTVNTSASCGIGRPCLCTAADAASAACKTLCVDSKGVYYLAASSGNSSTRGLVNWSFACPFVDLPEIKALRESFSSARNEYEKAQSALKESLNAPNTSTQRKSELRPCIDALSGIISDTANFVSYLDAVIAWPGIINTTSARGRATGIRTSIASTYNTYCRGASGLLQINSIIPPSAEKGESAQLVAMVSNVGNTLYYGYIQCDLTGGAGERIQENGTCTPIAGQSTTGFGFDFNASSAGRWSARCRAFGSLLDNCSLASVHNEAALQFNVSTRETFVVDVSGSCSASNTTSSLTCSARGSQANCVGCSSQIGSCTLVSSNGTLSRFTCPRSSYGNHTLFAYALDNVNCKPVPPQQKNVTVRCSGCGDGVVDTGEQCESPYSNNNQRCTQSQNTCQEKLFGIRDSAGFCSTDCSCSYDQYEFSCRRGQCGAECGDGETRTVTINTTAGSCACVQQCSSSCGWNACGCEPGSGGGSGTGGGTGTTASIGPPSVSVSHSPQNPTSSSVTLTATAVNSSDIEIYIDGFIVRTCQSTSCVLTATYTAGTHTYYARASNNLGVDTDPDQGTKSFTVPTGSTQNQTQNQSTNQSTTTNNSISLTLSHAPQNPTTLDTVTITGSASTNTDRIEIFVDGVLARACSEFVCSHAASYPAGNHNYFAIAYDGSASAANPSTGTRSFTVIQANATGTGTGGTAAAGITNIVLDVSHNPQSITTADSVTLTAIAHGPRSFREVNIFADNVLKKTCTNLPSSQPCTFRSTFPEGSHEYFATAVDVANNSARDPQSGGKSFSVSSAAPVQQPPPPGGPFIGSGQETTSGGTSSSGTGRCFASITDRNCTYNSATRRYDAKLSALWDNGTHAHWSIDGSEGPKMYQKNFTHVEPLSGPGMKPVKLLVHNANDSLLCHASSEIYCGPGSATDKDLDLIIDVKDVVRPGIVDVRVIAAPYININALRLGNYIDGLLNVSDVRIEGNTSLAGISSSRVAEDRTYHVYTVSTNLAAGRNISVLYKLRIDKAGEYKLAVVANYSNSQRVTKIIRATDCPQAFKVLAVGPDGTCKDFATPCDAAQAGFTLVDSCPTEEQEQPGFDALPLLIMIIIVIALALLLYKNRDRLRNFRRRSKEELPKFDEE